MVLDQISDNSSLLLGSKSFFNANSSQERQVHDLNADILGYSLLVNKDSRIQKHDVRVIATPSNLRSDRKIIILQNSIARQLTPYTLCWVIAVLAFGLQNPNSSSHHTKRPPDPSGFVFSQQKNHCLGPTLC